jgi:hypothetical protein
MIGTGEEKPRTLRSRVRCLHVRVPCAACSVPVASLEHMQHACEHPNTSANTSAAPWRPNMPCGHRYPQQPSCPESLLEGVAQPMHPSTLGPRVKGSIHFRCPPPPYARPRAPFGGPGARTVTRSLIHVTFAPPGGNRYTDSQSADRHLAVP